MQSLMLPRFVGEEKYIGEVYGHGARAFGKAIGTDDDVYWCDLITGTLYEGLQSPSGLSLVGVPVKTDMTITIKDILPNGKRNV